MPVRGILNSSSKSFVGNSATSKDIEFGSDRSQHQKLRMAITDLVLQMQCFVYCLFVITFIYFKTPHDGKVQDANNLKYFCPSHSYEIIIFTDPTIHS